MRTKQVYISNNHSPNKLNTPIAKIQFTNNKQINQSMLDKSHIHTFSASLKNTSSFKGLVLMSAS